MSYKCEVRTVGETSYCSNGLRFETEQECQDYGYDLWSHWFGADSFRVAVSEDAVNYRFIGGKDVRIES